jgi:hypothetical protein
MFESGIETTIIITAIVLWFAHGWYLNERLKYVHKKLDHVLEAFDGLRDYLYEIDPQFDDERQLLEDLRESLDNGSMSFSGMNHMELIKKKEQEGKRTLNTPLIR